MSTRIEIVNHPPTAVTLNNSRLTFEQKRNLTQQFLAYVDPVELQKQILLVHTLEIEDGPDTTSLITSEAVLYHGTFHPRLSPELSDLYPLTDGESAIIFRQTHLDSDHLPYISVRRLR